MKLILTLLTPALIFFAGCNTKRFEPDPAQQVQETPKPLQGAGLSYKGKRSGDLVEELYDELLSKDEGLKNLESLINDFRNRKQDSLESFFSFGSKNQSYYSSANSHLTSIQDSILAEKIKGMIHASESNYKNRVSGLQELKDEIEKKSASINDLHIALKIVKTLPIIDKFQQKSLPVVKPMDAILRDAGKIEAKADSAVNK
jgi:hypothetical protein